MQRVWYTILCLLIISLAGCSGVNYTTNIQESLIPTDNITSLPVKNLTDNALKWLEDDRLLFHSYTGLYVYSPSNGTSKTLLLEEAPENDLYWVNSWKYESSPDKSKYIMVTGKRNTLEIRESRTGMSKLSLKYSDRILEAGWVDNENVFLTTRYSLFIVNVLSGEQVQVTEDSSEVFAKATPNIEEPYISWVKNVKKIGDKLYYNGVRDLPHLRSSIIYRGDKSGEQELLENAILQIPVDDQRFVYFKQGEDGYDGTYLYNIETGRSSLITLEDLLNTGGVFPTNDGQLAFMTRDKTKGIYEGVVFDPLTLQSQKFEMYKRDWANKDIFNNEFTKFMGAFEKGGGYIFLFTVQNLTLSRQQWTFKNLSYNTKTIMPIKWYNSPKENRTESAYQS